MSSVNEVDSLSWGVLVGLWSVTKTSASSSRMQRVSRTWLSSELRGHRKGAASIDHECLGRRAEQREQERLHESQGHQEN